MKVFVYGTLMDGEPNHVFLGKSPKLGAGETKPIYTLYDLDAFPAMVFGGNTSIKGEVYEVSQEVLEGLDFLESYNSKIPENRLYNRQLIFIKLRDRDIAALAYFLDEVPISFIGGPPEPIIPSGDWKEALKGGYAGDEPLNNKKWK